MRVAIVNIITLNKIEELIAKEFSGYKECIILGKGPTFKKVESPREDTLVIGVNETVDHSDNVDMLVANDIETFERLNLDRLQHIKHILIPNKPHKNGSPKKEITYKSIITIIDKYFSGNLIVYNLGTSRKDPQFINLPGVITSGNTAADFVGHFTNTINKVTMYGIGVSSKSNYSKVFKVHANSGTYSKNRTVSIQESIMRSLDGKEIAFL